MIQTKSLAERMAEERMPVREVLRYAMQVGEALRHMHDGGQIHGAVTPDNILIGATGADLLPAPVGSAVITPYTAPEILEGRPADARSDIFGFGAVVFEMLTGGRAFESAGGPTPSSGSPAVDRLLGPCLSRTPETRAPGMQKVLMELKLLTVAARRAEAGAALAARRETGVDVAVIRAEMEQLESRMTARLADAVTLLAAPMREPELDATVIRAEMEQLESRITARLAEAVTAAPSSHYESGIDSGIIRREMEHLESRLAARLTTHERIIAEVQRSAAAEAAKEPLSARIVTVPERSIDSAGMAALPGQIDRIEKAVEVIRQHAAQFERSVAADLVDIERRLEVQVTSIESARTAVSRTDDLVERVVEALESLQTAVLDSGETGGKRANLAVN